ncbi:hypothetical protein GCM10009841_30280 [Microlunatus panaciterrae]|uniref:Galactose mutarotase-like enzyme n=1 Tax=Microlunatus panaciterrae TaxID=400768 RepID=A0ABS2RG72_9ACTN|nr:hypothetical protein [Microlunatus panaciterrae]MBM7797688.1 galactose mutarotase-like enzyme [Microlunatus panaciterrae]
MDPLEADSLEPRARVDADWPYRGFRAVVLENARLRAVVLPELGGKIISLQYKPADLELLWRHPRLPLRPVAFGSSYDDQFFGGWDELYPNDEAETLAGEAMPDHGEVWSLPWRFSTGTDATAAWVRLEVKTPISASRICKTLTLPQEGSSLTVGYQLQNVGCQDQPFMWKSHVAVQMHQDSLVDMGADSVLLHDFGHPRARGASPLFQWPTLHADGVDHDMRRPLAPNSGHSEFMLATSMHAGFCSVEHPSRGAALRLTFDLDALPSCWLFASYGWRGLNTVVLEPCTGYPLSVAQGAAQGTHQVLRAGETREWTLQASVGPAT